MYRRVADYLKESGLLNGFDVQFLKWRDNKNKGSKFVVFRPNGGSNLNKELGNEYHILIDLIGAVNDVESIDDTASAIADFIKDNPYSDSLGFIQIIGSIPAPVTTEEDRMVYRVLVSCTFG